jgi:hypothetical protein
VVIFGFEIGDFFFIQFEISRENTTFKAYITNFLSIKLGLEPNMIVEGFNSNLATYN